MRLELRRYLWEQSLDIEEGTLYPLVRRLEGFGLLHSRWSSGAGRHRRYYRLSAEGETVRDALAHEWRALNRVMDTVQENTP